MNLIRNTLMVVAFILLLLFGYIQFIDSKNRQSSKVVNQTHQTKNINQERVNRIILATISDALQKQRRALPLSTQYTDTLKEIPTKQSKPIPKITKRTTPQIFAYQKVESYAKKFLGYKYVWGATGPNTFDCSGFTQKVYRTITGINLPRVSRQQAKVGKYVQYSNLKKGDMVFFDTSKEHKGEVNHVGIYLGKNNFIHASSAKKKVIITNFKKRKFYKNRFLWGRRILEEQNNKIALLKPEVSES